MPSDAVRPKFDRDAPPCAYIDQNEPGAAPNAVKCSAFGALYTAHDRRGCRPVCAAHVAWLQQHSVMAGHSKDCPGHPPHRWSPRPKVGTILRSVKR